MKKLIAGLIMVVLIIAAFMAVFPAPAWADTGQATAPPITVDLTPLFQALIGVLATIITVKVVPYLKKKLTNEQQAALASATKVAVFAAEQLYGSRAGKKKLEYAQQLLLSKGFTVDINAIEAAVKELSLQQSAASGVKPPGK